MTQPRNLLLSRRQFGRVGLVGAAYVLLKWPERSWARTLKVSAPFVPPDLPLAEAHPSTAEWIRRAVILQPWGATEHKALTNAPALSRELRKEFGFNALIVLPTGAHNALTEAALPLTDAATRLTDSQFRAGLDAYRKEGYKLILYSSVMHCGHAPAWQSGQLGREHPEWLQRDALGETINEFGQAWLCPSSPARAYTLDYTLKLVRDYSPDGIMLDNNGFGHTSKGFTCFCEYCHRSFREYVVARCGAPWVRKELHVDPDNLRIPAEGGLLFALWICWRNRVWAETDVLFRSRLRQLQRNIIFFANTQYDLNPDPQASSFQFQREDLVFSETHESDSWYISQKMVYGQALTEGRPLWNYIATFRDSDPLRLRSPEEVSLMISSSLAHGALPWICYPGLDSVQDQQSRKEIARHVSWFALHPQLFVGKLCTPVGAVVSLLSRDVFESVKGCVGQGVTGCYASHGSDSQPLIPAHVEVLLRAGMPVTALRESAISLEKVRDFRIVTLATARILDARAADVLSSWVRAGGILIAASDAGDYDALGRKRTHSVLWQALGLTVPPQKSQRIGLGKVSIARRDRFDETVLSTVQSAKLAFTVPQGLEVVCYKSASKYLLHLVQHGRITARASLILPAWLKARAGVAHWFSPDWEEPRNLAFEPGRALDISGLPTYSVVTLNG